MTFHLPELDARTTLFASVACWAAFASYRIYESVAAYPAIWQDSKDYEAVAQHPWFSAALWAGSRPPLIPVMLKATHLSGTNFALGQGELGALAFGLLAWAVATVVRPGWPRLVAVVLVLAFGSAPVIVQWDWSVLSESASISALAVMGACGLFLAQRFTWPAALGLVVASAMYATARDESIWSVVCFGLAAIAAGSARALSRAAIGRRRAALEPRLLALGLVLLVVAALALTGEISSKRNTINAEDVFVVRIYPYPARVAWFAAHGMPDAAQIDALGKVTPPNPGYGPNVAPNLSAPQFAPLSRWLDGRAWPTYLEWLVTHPGYDFSAPFATPPLTFNNAQGVISFYDPRGDSGIAPPLGLLLPALGVAGLIGAGAVALGLSRGLGRRREWRFLVFFSLLGVVAMYIAWHGDGEEISRHVVEGNIEIHLGVLMLLLVALVGKPAEPSLAREGESGAAVLVGDHAPEQDEGADRDEPWLAESAPGTSPET